MHFLSNGGYAGFKLRLYVNEKRSVGLALRAIGGYVHVLPAYKEKVKELSGGDAGFGELWLMAAARRRRHGLMAALGLRLSQVTPCEVSVADLCAEPSLYARTKAFVTVSAEIGWEMRLSPDVTFYLALGADMFPQTLVPPDGDWEASPRFRTGLITEF